MGLLGVILFPLSEPIEGVILAAVKVQERLQAARTHRLAIYQIHRAPLLMFAVFSPA